MNKSQYLAFLNKHTMDKEFLQYWYKYCVQGL